MFNRGFSIAAALLNFAAIRSAQMFHTAGLLGLATAPPAEIAVPSLPSRGRSKTRRCVRGNPTGFERRAVLGRKYIIKGCRP